MSDRGWRPTQEESLARIAFLLERIADTADDYVDMALAGQLALKKMAATNPEMDENFRLLLEGLDAIRQRRENRE